MMSSTHTKFERMSRMGVSK